MSKPILVTLAALFILSPPSSAQQQQPRAPASPDDPTAQAPARPDLGTACDWEAMQEMMQAMHSTGGPVMPGTRGGMHGMPGQHGQAMQGQQGPGAQGMQQGTMGDQDRPGPGMIGMQERMGNMGAGDGGACAASDPEAGICALLGVPTWTIGLSEAQSRALAAIVEGARAEALEVLTPEQRDELGTR